MKGKPWTHIDLFSGIGGFAYAAREVWGKEYHNVFFCDNSRYCQEVIRKNFGKDSVIYGDIKEVIADTERLRKLQPQGCEQDKRGWTCDLLTAGVPCQPASCAGKRRGTKDDRWLWPQTFRVIRETQPRWIILENVRGILTLESGLVFKSLLTEMEGCGYETREYIIPAVAVNAPHRRDRVWIVANRKSGEPGEQTEQKRWENIGRGNSDVSNSPDERLQRSQQTDGGQREKSNDQFLYGCNREWDRDWLEVATRFCRVDDGLPAELDGLKLSKAGHRVERLKALGNAIVPQVAIEIMRAIKQTEESNG